MTSAQARMDQARVDVQTTRRAATVALASAESARHSANLAMEVSDTANRAAATALDRCDALVRQLSEKVAVDESGSVVTHVVAVARNAHAGLAHRMPSLGAQTATVGVADCGFLAEHMTLVPNMVWDEVDAASRCAHCAQEPAARIGSTLG